MNPCRPAGSLVTKQNELSRRHIPEDSDLHGNRWDNLTASQLAVLHL
jgi:hypothetical protein